MRAELTEALHLRFGVFELDLATGELCKAGAFIHLPPQPFKILALLARRPGQLVTREDIQQEIWGSETFVDFEHRLNFAIKKIRDVLGVDAETPRFIETLPRRGYRFIAPVDVGAHGGAPAGAPVSAPAFPVAAVSPPPTETAVRDRRYSERRLALAAGALLAIAAVLIALNVVGLRERVVRAVGAGRRPAPTEDRIHRRPAP